MCSKGTIPASQTQEAQRYPIKSGMEDHYSKLYTIYWNTNALFIDRAVAKNSWLCPCGTTSLAIHSLHKPLWVRMCWAAVMNLLVYLNLFFFMPACFSDNIVPRGITFAFCEPSLVQATPTLASKQIQRKGRRVPIETMHFIMLSGKSGNGPSWWSDLSCAIIQHQPATPIPTDFSWVTLFT